MKTQNRLSELDAITLALWKAREQLFVRERDAFYGRLLDTYGNPGEALTISDDGRTIIRKAPDPEAKARKRKG